MKEKCNLFLLLLFLFVGVEAAKANVESFDFTKMGFSADQQINEVKGKGITISFDAIAGTMYRPYWNNNYQSVVVYGYGDSSTISANHPGYKIWRIVITFSNNTGEYYIKDSKYVKVNIGDLVTNKNITTWKGGADNVTFTNLSNHEWWIQKIDVYYSVGGNGRTAANPYTVGDINTFFSIDRAPKSERYIRGIVSQVGTWDSSTGTISYHLSDNGIDTATIVVNGGKYLNDEAITSKYQIARGDTLTVYGMVSKNGNTLVVQKDSLVSFTQCKDQITIKAAGWATYVSHRPIDFSQTAGVQAFQTTFEATSNTIVLSPITAIPENTAVVLKGTKGSYTFENIEHVLPPLTSNELTFFTVDTPVTEDRTVYVLACKQGVCGFFPFAKGKSLPSYKGYLLIKSGPAAKPFYRVGTTTPTAIRPVEQLQHPTVRYNLAGERVDNNYKGVVIENGKKIIVR